MILLYDARYRLIHLRRCRGASRKTVRKMLRLDPTLKQIYKMTSSEIEAHYQLPPKTALFIFADLHDTSLIASINKDLKRFQALTIIDEKYPSALKTIPDAPLVLYAAGDITLLQKEKALSVIGTRNPSAEAKRKMDYIVTPIIHDKWVIVSGMAKGIDSMAHKLTLQNHGTTIAVLGGGFDHIYPKQNTALFHQMTKEGLILSEYPPSIPPQKFHFPERNRIISGLSYGTIVVEATEKSGTLITVEQALDQGREVYAIPGSPLLKQTAGCHKLIQEGAKLVRSAEDVIKDWETVGKFVYLSN